MEIVNASEGDAPALGELIADSLSHLPLARWLVTDAGDWKKIAPRYFEAEVRDAVANGVVYTFADLSGAVVVFDHRDKHEPAPERESWLRQITGPYYDTFNRFETALLERRPSKPHQYGALVAVRSTERNKRSGSRLLDHHHRILDERGQDVYGEASSKELVGFFARHGYSKLGQLVTLDGQDLVQPIWREARRAD